MREVNLQIFNDVEREEAKAFEVQNAIGELCLCLDFGTKGYKVSICRNQVNDKLAESRIFISIFLVSAMIIFRKQKCVFLNLIYLLKHRLLHLTKELFVRTIH